MLGIVDRVKGKNNQNSQGKDYAVYYFCYNGQVYPRNLGINGEVINSGEIVEVVVELSKGKVEFKVGNLTIATVNNYNILL
jgi:predicted SnoaL-like aldol condensation-catalyzing enzyme